MVSLYICSLCAGCRPTRKNNIEQHIWQMHAQAHGQLNSDEDGRPIKYRASLHKPYVERFCQRAGSKPTPGSRAAQVLAAQGNYDPDGSSFTSPGDGPKNSTSSSFTSADRRAMGLTDPMLAIRGYYSDPQPESVLRTYSASEAPSPLFDASRSAGVHPFYDDSYNKRVGVASLNTIRYGADEWTSHKHLQPRGPMPLAYDSTNNVLDELLADNEYSMPKAASRALAPDMMNKSAPVWYARRGPPAQRQNVFYQGEMQQWGGPSYDAYDQPFGSRMHNRYTNDLETRPMQQTLDAATRRALLAQNDQLAVFSNANYDGASLRSLSQRSPTSGIYSSSAYHNNSSQWRSSDQSSQQGARPFGWPPSNTNDNFATLSGDVPYFPVIPPAGVGNAWHGSPVQQTRSEGAKKKRRSWVSPQPSTSK